MEQKNPQKTAPLVEHHYHKAPDECSGLSTSKPVLLAALHSLHSLAQWIATQATSSSTFEALGPSESNDSAAPTLLPVLLYKMVDQNKAKTKQAMKTKTMHNKTQHGAAMAT